MSRTSPGTEPSDVEEVRVMPQQGCSKKRERQYEHIKQGLEDRGRSSMRNAELARAVGG
jgi:hypothetical protein